MSEEEIKIKQEEIKIKQEEIEKEIEIFQEYRKIKEATKTKGFQITVYKENKDILYIETPHRKGKKFYLTEEQKEEFTKIIRVLLEPTRQIRRKREKPLSTKKVTIIAKRYNQLRTHFPELFETKGDIDQILNN
jgi:hypothetical protein